MSGDEPASPACLAHEAEDAYMGFATREEIMRFLSELETATPAAAADRLREILPKIRDDTLYAELSARLAAIESADSCP